MTKDMNMEKDFVYLVTVVKSTLSMILVGCTNLKNKSHKIKSTYPNTYPCPHILETQFWHSHLLLETFIIH